MEASAFFIQVATIIRSLDDGGDPGTMVYRPIIFDLISFPQSLNVPKIEFFGIA